MKIIGGNNGMYRKIAGNELDGDMSLKQWDILVDHDPKAKSFGIWTKQHEHEFCLGNKEYRDATTE